MEVGLFSIGVGRTSDPDMIAHVARKADDVGFASLWAPEHTVLFDEADYTSRYPYNDAGRIRVGRGNLLDPFAALTFAAAHSSRMKLGTGICLVPHRNPLITAKMVSSLDQLSKGRFLFGVGIGWLKEEFVALGVPPERRAQRTCEHLEAMKALWTQDPASFSGEFSQFPPLISRPKPVQQPHPPIIFGGNSEPALRRVVHHGNGWFGFNILPDDTAQMIKRMSELAAEAGKNVEDYAMIVGVSDQFQPVTLDVLKQYRDAGVQQAVVRLPTADPELIEGALDEMAEQLVAPAQGL
jgi:probable F420-dependent oxidoreductase